MKSCAVTGSENTISNSVGETWLIFVTVGATLSKTFTFPSYVGTALPSVVLMFWILTDNVFWLNKVGSYFWILVIITVFPSSCNSALALASVNTDVTVSSLIS